MPVMALVALLSVATMARAEEFYVEPGSGSMAGDGSISNPWSTLEAVVDAGLIGTAVVAGDTVWLGSGYHGELALGEGDYMPPITLAAVPDTAPDARPELARVRFAGASGVVLRGVSISPAHAPSYETGTLVTIGDGSDRITVEACELFSEDDVSGWGADEWIDRASNGFQIGGEDAVVRDNLVRNVRHGIGGDGARALVDGNTIDGFSADGLRGLGDYQTFQYNVVKNVYVDGDLDDNHDDGFQSWSLGADGTVGTGEVRGMVLRGNLIINYEDPNQPLRATLQGIGCFDGTFVDWVVENNVVITDHWHGITLLGARDSRIVNNTVMDVNDERPGPPWISIDAHKDGTPPEGCLVRNNLATDYANADTVTEDHNFVIDDPAALFVDPAAHDLRLLASASDAIDQGSADMAPELDGDRIPRPQGAAVDLGAFEWHEPDVQPAEDGGTGATPPTSTAAGDAGGASGSGAGASGTGDAGSTAGAGGGTSSAPEADGGTGDAGPASTTDANDDGGCSCRAAGLPGRVPRPWLALLTAVALVVGRKRLGRRGARVG